MPDTTNNQALEKIINTAKEHGLPALKIVIDELAKRKPGEPLMRIAGKISARIALEVLTKRHKLPLK